MYTCLFANLDKYFTNGLITSSGNELKMKLDRGLQSFHVWYHAFEFLQARLF